MFYDWVHDWCHMHIYLEIQLDLNDTERNWRLAREREAISAANTVFISDHCKRIL